MVYRNVVVLLFAVLCVSSASAAAFGTYLKLFNAQSLWNSKPINPVFAPNVSVPMDDIHPTWVPVVAGGAYSTGVFLAKNSDPAVTVYGFGTNALKNVDAWKNIDSITIPHWPADAVGATGTDGHCDIVDEDANMIHSFWQLRYNNVTKIWNATQYAWSPLDGYGFGVPGHFYQGARAAGVPTSAGLIRKDEASDTEPMFYHALACALTYSGLSNNPTYIYPATSADGNAATTNYGKVPEGALLMLPSDFNTSRITSPNIRKVAETLKVYGMYAVDRNDGTPYSIFVENGASFKLSNKTGWDNDVANQLLLIRANLKMLSSCDYYEDGNGQKLVQPYPNQNLLSMRGTDWNKVYGSGDATVRYDTWSQSLVFEQTNNKSTTFQSWAGQGINTVSWAKLQKGVNYTVTVEATANCTLKFVFEYNSTSGYFSKTLGNGEVSSFVWPTTASSPYMVLYATKPAGGPGRVRGFIYATENIVPMPSSTTSNAGTTGTTGTNNAATTAATTEGGPANEDSAGTMVYPSLVLAFVLAYLFI